ncbi:MAG: ATPase, T2SS/T4P/T4SS family [Candidatus Omnitrophota bacterium]
MPDGATKIKKLLGDPAITEIMVNGSQATFIEVAGRKKSIDVIFNPQEIKEVIDEVFKKGGRNVSVASPYADICLEDGSRVNVIISPLARLGAAITIRKFSQEIKSLDDLTAKGTLSQKMAELLIACIKGRLNILFSGATGAGKTTTLEMLSFHIPKDERIVTIEDTAELKLHHKNLVSLETRSPDEAGKGEVTLRDLIRNALRMRPDRIIVGEVRGAEAIDMIQAMSTGHKGTLAVVHGNSPQEIVSRLETMILSSGIKLPIGEIRKMIANTVDIIVQQERFLDGSRRITHISEVRDLERGEITIQNLFVFKAEGKNPDGKIKGKFTTTMRMYPKFFADFQKLDLLGDKAFSD